jgi:hypothetical protein
MKLKELHEAKRPYSAKLYIKQFNEDEETPAQLMLNNLELDKIPMQIKSSENTTYDFGDNKLSTFDNFPEEARILKCNRNNFQSLHNIHKYIKKLAPFAGTISIFGNPIKSHVLGLLKIENLREVILYGTGDDKVLITVEEVINKHLKKRDILACQQELIDAGLEEFAQL